MNCYAVSDEGSRIGETTGSAWDLGFAWENSWAETGLTCPRLSYPGSRASGRTYSRVLLGPRMDRDSRKVQEGTDVVIPGEGPKQLHHFRHVLLSTRPREKGKTDWVLLRNPHHPRCPRAPWLPLFQGSRGHSSWAGTSLGLPGTINVLVLELRRDRTRLLQGS